MRVSSRRVCLGLLPFHQDEGLCGTRGLYEVHRIEQHDEEPLGTASRRHVRETEHQGPFIRDQLLGDPSS